MNIINGMLHPRAGLTGLWARFGQHVRDDLYLRVRFRLIFGYPMDIENPQGFNEKINWKLL